MNFFINYFFENWIAISSLSLSLYTLFKNRVNIDVDFVKVANWGLLLLLDDGKSIANEYGFVHANIKIINSSNKDIGFFDLRVFDNDSDEEYIYFNSQQSNIFNGLKNSRVISMLTPDNKQVGLNLPSASHGILKAHSLTSLDIVISPEKKIGKFFVVFKISEKKSFINRKNHAYINSPYQSFSGLVSVEQENKPNYEEVLSELHRE